MRGWLTGLALLLLLLLPFAPTARAAPSERIVRAVYAEPTDRYDHAILGDALEWGALVLTVGSCPVCADGATRTVTLRLLPARVFEDIAPRIVPDGKGGNLVMVVETDFERGASLALWNSSGRVFATPFLGRPYRWLAPLGMADLDRDGRLEIAYVEKPHLTKILKVWDFDPDRGLTFRAALPGLSNHRIGQDFISGGIRDCGQGPEIITADGDWQQVMATRLAGRRLVARALGPFAGPASLKAALACRL